MYDERFPVLAFKEKVANKINQLLKPFSSHQIKATQLNV